MIDFRQRPNLPLPLGNIVQTPGAQRVLAKDDATPWLLLLIRHSEGDWGNVCDEDAALNDDAVVNGGRVLSVYKLDSGDTVWIITEADRSVTTILLPSEY